MTGRLLDFLPDVAPTPDEVGDAVMEAVMDWAEARGLELYPHQEEAILEVLSGSNVVLATPTGSGKSMVALAAHARSVVERDRPNSRSWYTAPVKALVSEKFFDLCEQLGAEHVGLLTGDSSVNPDAPVICCTTEILALAALKDGPELDAATVILDEFHFYGDEARGWAWQTPLLSLPQSSFVLLSATLGDVSFLRDDLTKRTGRPTALVDDAVRPVPLEFEYRDTLLHQTIEDLLASDSSPLYLVNFSQRDAVAMATAMSSIAKLDDEAKAIVSAELAAAKLPAGFGRDLARLLRNGVGVHHAGMLPRYRRLVERLTQQGVLHVISGTDTLGIGVNLPIRTVVLTRLYKYDGTDNRLLTAREFHQIAGRAGRAGYDTRGLVVCLAPDHVAANEAAEAKAAADPKKKKKVKKSQPPKGFVHYDRATFQKLIDAPPEKLGSSMTMTPGMLLQLLDRPGDAWAHARELLLGNHEPRAKQRRLVRSTLSLFKAFRTAGIVRRLDAPDAYGRFVEVDTSLQDDFALNQLLSPFLLHAVPLVEPPSDDVSDEQHALAVLALVEAVCDNPTPILFAQRDKARDEAMSEMKAARVGYEQRIAELDKINYPQPMREQIYDVFDAWRVDNPWIGDRNIAPKGVVRDLWERAMDFPSFVRHYGLKRSEGLLLRYLSDVYKTLVRTIPEADRTDAIDELAAWLGAVIRATDSSLLDEWAAMKDGATAIEAIAAGAPDPDAGPPTIDITTDRRAFRALVRTRAFRWVTLAATGQWAEFGDDVAEFDRTWNERKLLDAFEPYLEAYGDLAAVEVDPNAPVARPGEEPEPAPPRPDIGLDGDARGPDRFVLSDDGDAWTVEQILADPEGHDEWYLAATIDLPASAEAGAVVGTFDGLHRR